MSDYERIEAANNKFCKKFEGPDEWTEMFGHAYWFARRLLDTNDNKLREDVIKWLEEACNAPDNSEED